MKAFKILSLSATCLIAALAAALIPINIFCANFPAWVTILLSAVFCGKLISYLICYKTKLITKIILPLAFGTIALFCSLFPYAVPYWNSYSFKNYSGTVLGYDEIISYETAKKDLSTLKNYLKHTHPKFRDGLTVEVENAFNLSFDRLRGADEITVNVLRREIQSILHIIGDAHTTTYNDYPNDRYLKTIPQKYSQGYDITAINGKTVKTIIDDIKPYYCYEAESWISIDLGSLATLDFLQMQEPFTYEWTNGDSIIEEAYTEDDFVDWTEFLNIRDKYTENEASASNEFVYYVIDEHRSLAVLTLSQCEYNQEYVDCLNQMFTEVKQKNIKTVAVDLRGNGGGSSQVGNEFLKYLPIESYTDGPFDWRWGFLNFHNDGKKSNIKYDNLTFEGNVFALTDSYSFSAAKDFAMLLQDNGLGKVIGEPSANSVNGYGEIASFYLPNTGLYVQISTKKWYRIDGGNSNEFVMPDYPCESANCFTTLYDIID